MFEIQYAVSIAKLAEVDNGIRQRKTVNAPVAQIGIAVDRQRSARHGERDVVQNVVAGGHEAVIHTGERQFRACAEAAGSLIGVESKRVVTVTAYNDFAAGSGEIELVGERGCAGCINTQL